MASDTNWPPRFEGHVYPQVIPQPDDIQPGQPAPWRDVAPTTLSLSHVVEQLRGAKRHLDVAPLPGDPAEMAAVADAKRQEITRKSAVLVALFEKDGEVQVILTRRSFKLRSHKGEIALPGGRSDEGETPIQTALREAREEVGLREELVNPVGWLSPIVTFASGSAIWPVVGILDAEPELRADPSEVERVFCVPLSALLEDGVFLEERWRREQPRPGSDDEGYFPIYFFRVPGELIWGATARILTELLCVVTGTQWPDRDRVWS